MEKNLNETAKPAVESVRVKAREQSYCFRLELRLLKFFFSKQSNEKVTRIPEIEADVNISRGLERGFQESLLIGRV